ncbi:MULTISPECIES: hypothetical protein [Pseudomonas]|uniref:hypothetical protein n=1 Tax=Pseudomonas TaxID=286 RepID=UPI003001EA56
MAGLTKAQKAERALLAKAVELSGVNADEFALLSDDERAALIEKAQAEINADDGADAAGDDEVDNSHLITVKKDGEELEVHPACLADHKRLGWKEV